MTHYLIPHRYKKIGRMLFVFTLVAGVPLLILNPQPEFLDMSMFAVMDLPLLGFGDTEYFTMIQTNILRGILSILAIVSLFFIGFSREKTEDEFFDKLRLQSLAWAIYINYIILVLAVVFLYGGAFLYALAANMFTVLLCFVARFEWEKYKLRRRASHEKQG